MKNENKIEIKLKYRKYVCENLEEELLFPNFWIYKGKKYVINTLEDYREVYKKNYAEKAIDDNEYRRKKFFKRLTTFYKPFKKLWGKKGVPFPPFEEKLKAVFIKIFGGEWKHLQNFFLEQLLKEWVFIRSKEKANIYNIEKRNSLGNLEILNTLRDGSLFPLTWEIYFNKIIIRENEVPIEREDLS